MHYVLGQDPLLSQCLSSLRSINPLTLKRPKPPVKDLGICPAWDFITFNRERRRMYSNCGAGRDLSNDTKTIVIGLMDLAICTKTLQNCSEKLGGKFSLPTLCLSMVSMSYLSNAFSEILPLKKNLVEGQQLRQKDRKKRKGKSEKKKKKNEKPKVVGWFIVQILSQNFDLCACLSKKVIKADSSEKQGRVLCFKGHIE